MSGSSMRLQKASGSRWFDEYPSRNKKPPKFIVSYTGSEEGGGGYLDHGGGAGPFLQDLWSPSIGWE